MQYICDVWRSSGCDPWTKMWCDVMWRDVMWCDVMWCDVMLVAMPSHVMSCWTSSVTLLDRPAYWLSGDQHHRGQSDTVQTNKNVTLNNVFISLHQPTWCGASQRSLYRHMYSDCMLLRDRTDHWQGPSTLHPVSVPWVRIPSLLSTGLDWLAQSRQYNIMEKWCWLERCFILCGLSETIILVSSHLIYDVC